MREYLIEDGKSVDRTVLEAEFMPSELYLEAHRGLIIPCHDVMIEYDGGLVLVVRDNHPAKGILWPVGGRIKRGVSLEDSLRDRVKSECNLDLTDISQMGIARTLWTTDPFGHGQGTDTLNLLYFARGQGNLKLDDLHADARIVRPADYTEEFRSHLHAYVQDFLNMTMHLVR